MAGTTRRTGRGTAAFRPLGWIMSRKVIRRRTRVLRSWVPLDIVLGQHRVHPRSRHHGHTSNPGDRGRFSAKRKTDAVLRLLRGEDLELVSRELGVIAATLSGWRDDFLAGGHAALKSRPTDDRDDEIARLRPRSAS